MNNKNMRLELVKIFNQIGKDDDKPTNLQYSLIIDNELDTRKLTITYKNVITEFDYYNEILKK